MFEGVFTAIVTPFDGDKVDTSSLKKLTEWLISEGVHGIVPCGTTGEGATLSDEESILVIKTVAGVAKGKVPVIAGAGSNNTKVAVENTLAVKRAGADAALHVTPYYNKPPQEGLYRHYEALSRVGFPIVAYNVPGRTAVNMLPETTIRISELPNIVGVKECGGVEHSHKIINGAKRGFVLLSGEDALNLDLYKIGARGAISVTANVAPKMVAEVWENYLAGKLDDAKKQQARLDPLNKVMFIETNPIPAKAALEMMGFVRGEVRLPLVPMSEDGKEKLKEVLRECKLI